ncbi:MAG: AI-2E family transporter [Acidobacteria bacterium]|nr:AI-2E family transporter [Acidobacteriota bacterium]
MNHERVAGRGARFLLVAASVVVILAGLKAAAGLVLPFLVAVFLALVSLPLLNLLQVWRVPRWAAVGLTLILVICVLFLLIYLLAGSIAGFTADLPVYQARLEAMTRGLVAWVEAHGVKVPREMPEGWLNPGNALELVAGGLRTATSILSNLALVVLTVVFILLEAAGFPDKLRAAFPGGGDSVRLGRIRTEVQRYLGVKFLVGAATGAVLAAVLTILRVDFALLWGVLACVANFIPALGSVLAAVPPILLALVEFGPGRAIAVAIAFMALVSLGNLAETALVGRRLGMSILAVFISLVFWAWLWGPVGMFLAVPLTILLKIVLENTEDLRWVAVMLDAGPRARPSAKAE